MIARDEFGLIERGPAGQASARLFVFARHAESTANASGVVSSDPHRPVALTERGRKHAGGLGAQVAGLNIELAVATRFRRTQETAALALGSPTRAFPDVCDSAPVLADIAPPRRCR